MPLPIEVLNQTLALPPADRAELAHQLILSLEPPEVQDDPGVWEAEFMARLDAVESGNYEARDWHEALADIRKRLAMVKYQVSA